MIVLVSPGPEVTITTPGIPVRRPTVFAANAAVAFIISTKAETLVHSLQGGVNGISLVYLLTRVNDSDSSFLGLHCERHDGPSTKVEEEFDVMTLKNLDYRLCPFHLRLGTRCFEILI